MNNRKPPLQIEMEQAAKEGKLQRVEPKLEWFAPIENDRWGDWLRIGYDEKGQQLVMNVKTKKIINFEEN